MAAGLFVITIPTEAEEERLKTEFIAKRTTKAKDQKTTTISFTSLATANTNTTTCTTGDGEDRTSNTSEISTTPVMLKNVNEAQQYGTFPKWRKFDCIVKPVKNETRLSDEECTTPNSTKEVDIEAIDTAPIMRKSWEGLRDILSSAKRKSNKRKENSTDLDIPSNTCMEVVLREILKRFQVLNAIWTKDTEGRMYQISFTLELNEKYEHFLDKLHEWGFGDREGSTVSVMNCIVSKTFTSKDEFEMHDEYKRLNMNAQKQGAWNRFMNSVRSRLNVEQIVRDVRQDASITFDFIILLVSAAILASFGLVEDSTIFLASSMLISPLMGPIIAAIFGTVIKDKSLRTLGLKNELIGIVLAIFVGFLFGLIVCTTNELRYGIGDGLTAEMLARCEIHSLVVGVFTAIPSGAAAAVGILGGNIGSLVGVAISASLLPPAVNSGLLWALACVYKFFETDTSRYVNVVKSHSYSDNQATELAILGSISMGLTISNVICVYIMGVLVLKVKEIAPVISRNHREFWKHDIKIARDLNRNGSLEAHRDTAIIDEFTHLPKEDQKALGINCDLLRNIHLNESGYQNTWSPLVSRHPFEITYDRNVRENYTTVHHIERLYSTITQPQSLNDRRLHRFGLTRITPERVSDIAITYTKFPEILTRSRSGADADNSYATVQSEHTSETPTTSSIVDVQTHRKFLVTPALDPLKLNATTDDAEA